MDGNPANYRAMLRTLKAGDTLNLAPGSYDRLAIVGLNGEPDAWITIAGPATGAPAVILGKQDSDTVSIDNSSYVSIENLRIDSRGIPGAFGISTKGHEGNVTHHIRVQGNVLVGQGGGQQTDGISTKTPTWGWIIRYNQILGAGTGIYLGDSDGNQPFVRGLIENNLVEDSIGYNLEIKHQNNLPDVPGMPTGPGDTIIRNNVFIKNDRPSPDGDRPNVILGAFPSSGPNALSMYEVYGNYFIHNHREALFQASGRVNVHDNVFVDGPYNYPAVVMRAHQGGPLKIGYFYNNTIYTSSKGIYFGTRATIDDAVVGNVIFGSAPVSGQIMRQSDNVVDWPANAEKYVAAPTFDREKMDFYPLAGKCQGAAVDLSMFHSGSDYARDFNGLSKVLSKGAVVFRGAYAGDGVNPGWLPRAGIKPPLPPVASRKPGLVWIAPATGRAGSTVKLELFGEDFQPEDRVEITGNGIQFGNVEVPSATRITVSAKISAGLPASEREVTVVGAKGKSNPLRFRVVAAR
ncbi:MAG: hypothetical protein ABI806_26245 [Candidatus Solibacter sp.]